MFAFLALICFILALVHIPLGTVDLVVLGLTFIAAHLFFGIPLPIPWPWRNNPNA